MNMYGWTTWGNFDPGDANNNYRGIGPMQLFKHHTGLMVALPVGCDIGYSCLALSHMNEFLEDMQYAEQCNEAYEEVTTMARNGTEIGRSVQQHMSATERTAHVCMMLCTGCLWYPIYAWRKHRIEETTVHYQNR
jgi:hypothetical protein